MKVIFETTKKHFDHQTHFFCKMVNTFEHLEDEKDVV